MPSQKRRHCKRDREESPRSSDRGSRPLRLDRHTPLEPRESVVRSDDDDDPKIPADSNFVNTVDGEWRIHGIIGEEVIEGEIHYWHPTFVPERELERAVLGARI
jgi:hypothetical protein